MAQIISPKSGQMITVGSDEFSELLADPKYRKTILLEEMENVAYSPPSPSSSLDGFQLPLLKSLPPLQNSCVSQGTCSDKLPNLKVPLSPSSPRNKLPPVSELNLSHQFAAIPKLEETLKNTKQPAQREKLEKMRYEEGRGIKTSGWQARSPTQGKERDELHEKCGDKCFLLPGEEKFPVCASLRAAGDQACKVDCQGVQSALIRSRQHGYTDVAQKAEKLLQECNKEGLKNFVPENSPKWSEGMERSRRYSADS